MIRRATSHDLDAVEQTYMELFAWERRNGRHSHWIPGVWPTRSTLRRAIAKDELFVFWDDRGAGKKIYASIALTKEQPAVYRTIHWKNPAKDGSVLVARLLCVSPLFSRQGIGSMLLHSAMERGPKMHCTVLRFHCVSGDTPMEKLCAKLGLYPTAQKEIPLSDEVNDLPTFNSTFYECPLVVQK